MGFTKTTKCQSGGLIRTKRGVRFVWFCCFLITLVSCGENREQQLSYLRDNLAELEGLRQIIQSKYHQLLTDSSDTRRRIVFIDCAEEGNLSTDYICNDTLVLNIMRGLNIREVRFEKKGSRCAKSSMYNEIYFQRKSIIYTPTVYYLYEYCGAGEKFESQTIFYNPIDSNWGLYIDSNYP